MKRNIKIFDEYEKLVKETIDSHLKTVKIVEECKRQCIDFANWIQVQGWYYGVNGNYYFQSLGNDVMQLTPSQLFDTYKLETKK